MLANEIAELAEFEAPGFCSSSEFRSALTGAVWASLDFQITEDSHRISPASVRVAALTNINIDAPGSTINGVTLNTEPTPDIVLLPHQAKTSQNGLYVFNGASSPMTRL